MRRASVRRQAGIARALRRQAVALAATAAALGAARAGAREAYEYPTNFELLRGALVEATKALLATLPDSVSRAKLVVAAEAPASLRAQLVGSAVGAALVERHVAVCGDCAGRSVLEARVGRMGVAVPATRRAWPLGRRWADRQAVVVLSATLRDERGLVIWTADGEGRSADRLPVSALAWAAGPGELGLAPELDESAWLRAVEPLIVMSSVGAAIYLFFTQ